MLLPPFSESGSITRIPGLPPSPPPPRFDGVRRGLTYIVLLVAKMFYRKRTQSEIGPGKRGWGGVGLQETRCELRGSPPSEVTQDALNPSIKGLGDTSQGSVAKPECPESL